MFTPISTLVTLYFILEIELTTGEGIKEPLSARSKKSGVVTITVDDTDGRFPYNYLFIHLFIIINHCNPLSYIK